MLAEQVYHAALAVYHIARLYHYKCSISQLTMKEPFAKSERLLCYLSNCAAAGGAEGDYINKFTCNYIKEIIDKLDLKYRDVIVLKGYGYGYEEIAYLMHISQELVRKRYSRAKKMIIEMGGEMLYEYGN